MTEAQRCLSARGSYATLLTGDLPTSQHGIDIDPKPEQEASGSFRNGIAWYVTEHCTGKRR
jgi:hypothetical protein